MKLGRLHSVSSLIPQAEMHSHETKAPTTSRLSVIESLSNSFKFIETVPIDLVPGESDFSTNQPEMVPIKGGLDEFIALRKAENPLRRGTFIDAVGGREHVSTRNQHACTTFRRKKSDWCDRFLDVASIHSGCRAAERNRTLKPVRGCTRGVPVLVGFFHQATRRVQAAETDDDRTERVSVLSWWPPDVEVLSGRLRLSSSPSTRAIARVRETSRGAPDFSPFRMSCRQCRRRARTGCLNRP
jgi:hypothetical protein